MCEGQLASLPGLVLQGSLLWWRVLAGKDLVAPSKRIASTLASLLPLCAHTRRVGSLARSSIVRIGLALRTLVAAARHKAARNPYTRAGARAGCRHRRPLARHHRGVGGQADTCQPRGGPAKAHHLLRRGQHRRGQVHLPLYDQRHQRLQRDPGGTGARGAVAGPRWREPLAAVLRRPLALRLHFPAVRAADAHQPGAPRFLRDTCLHHSGTQPALHAARAVSQSCRLSVRARAHV